MILNTLKERTREAHERLEETVDVVATTRSLETYRALLERYLGIYEPLEARLVDAGMGEIGLAYPPRERTSLLERDLRALGMTPDEMAALPRCERLPDASTLARAVGCRYVLEGASLGGSVISRHVRTELGLGPEDGCAFFVGAGSSTGPVWQEFRAHVNEWAPDEALWDEVVDAANATFTAFEDWLVEARRAQAN